MALSVTLALVALPSLVGSRSPGPVPSVEAAAFQAVLVRASAAESSVTIGSLDPAYASAGQVTTATTFIEPGTGATGTDTTLAARPKLNQPEPSAGIQIKPPLYTLRGIATFYNAGFTAMRLPRGTIIRVCGDGGCVERVVSDWGPLPGSARIVDLYRPDFFSVCGCAWWSGTTWVTVGVY